MKKFLPIFVCFLLLAGWIHTQQMNLNDVIKRAARSVEEVLPQRAMVAVLNFVSPTETFSDYVIEELTGELVAGRKVTIVDRRNLALISQEMNLQLSGDVSDESAQAIGRKLGAQSIVSGTLTNMGSFYRFRVKVINVETAAIQTQVSLDLQNDAQVAFLLNGSPTASGSAAAPAPSTPSVPQPASTPTSTTYKVGDTGPAGGIVFYDKGVRESGWRYLEAAPTDFTDVQWSSSSIRIVGTGTGIGDGKKNTQMIIAEFTRLGETSRAAQYVAAYDGGGFADWFLPSMDELNVMYRNLKQKGMGGFSNDWYWSSSTYTVSIHRGHVYRQRFSDGRQEYTGIGGSATPCSVRAIRAF
ncbi:MAG: hypothetical protein FWG07_09585 [Treponema sp.]|nr:hypothetical protein [Treponema sp.]